MGAMNTRIIEAEYDYVKPSSLDEALDILAEKERVRIYAGGTDLIVKLKMGADVGMDIMMDINGIDELFGVTGTEDGGLRIGAAEKIWVLETHPDIIRMYPALAKAMHLMASVSVRNMASIGGNICNASPVADTVGPCMCYGACVELRNKKGVRTVDATEFFLKPGVTVMEADEILTAIILPAPQKDTGAGFIKMARVRPDIAKVSISSTEENRNSLILRLDYGERSFLFTGDTTDSVLRSVGKAYPGMLDVDVLKNPHHNGQHADDVIGLISPKYVVFCTDNDSQPISKYKRALRKQGAELYITGSKNQGHVGLVTDGHDMEVRCGYAVESLSLPSDTDMYVGQTLSLKCGVTPSDALNTKRQLGWRSSDESVAKVYEGTVRAVAPGEATISATAVNGVTASVEVRVYSAVVAIDHTELRLGVGDSQKLRVRVKPDNVKDVTGEWVSEDESVAVVFNGTVTGVSEGETRVIARLSNGHEAVCAVTVGGATAKSVKLDKRKATMKVGDTLALTAAVKPAEYDVSELEWRSSDESVLWVDAYGNVTAVSKGKAKVAAIASEKVYDVCAITVKD